MKTSRVLARVTLPFWAGAFIRSCVIFALLFGFEPDVDKIAKFVARRARVRIEIE